MIFNCSKINLICLSEETAQQQNPSSQSRVGLVLLRAPFLCVFPRQDVEAHCPWRSPKGPGPQGLRQVCALGQLKDRRTQMEMGKQDRALPLCVTCVLRPLSGPWPCLVLAATRFVMVGMKDTVSIMSYIVSFSRLQVTTDRNIINLFQ